MKKTISLILAVLMLFMSVGCKSNKNEAKDNSSPEQYAHGVNVMAYAKDGEIPEVPFKLGDSIEKVKNEFKSTIPEGSEIEDLIITEGQETVQMDGGSSMFFYEKKNESKGIGMIVAKESAFQLSLGGVYSGEDIIEIMGTDDYERVPTTEADAFFLPGQPELYECVAYNADKYVLKFILVNGYVSAVTLTDPEIWGS